jgi:two-component system cell cycle sensor histidine kinase/response regulator CckA
VKILHIEDSAEDAELVRALLVEEWPDCVISLVTDRRDVAARLAKEKYDLILSDFTLGSFTGLDALRIAKEKAPGTPFIFISGTIGEDRAIEALQAGAQDYVIKDRMKRLVTAIHRAMRDGLDRRQREAAERRIRKQAELLNKAHDAIIVTDLADVVTFWNHGAERLSGWTPEQAFGRNLKDVLGTGADAELEKARAALEEADEWRGDLRLEGRNGKALVMELSATLIRDDAGEPESRLFIGSDVTSKKTLEEQFLRVQRLESIGMLASGIAHDLNNILAPIFLAAPLLREHATDPGDIRMITALEKSAERGAGMVRQILSFAQGVSGSQQQIKVKHLMQDTASVINETFPKNIRLDYSVPDNLWPVMANPTQIHQILLNLCVNSRDAMPKGGTLIFRAENCLLDESAAQAIEGAHRGAWVVLHVEDTGVGIPPQTLARIWEPFFTTKEVGKGTGIGLSTVRGIVENHKGFTVLESQPGRGTSFRVYLPAAAVADDGDPSRAEFPFAVRGNGELILIVDDEDQIRETAAATLAHYGYRVLVAKDGTGALALFSPRSGEISVVITDLDMPNLDGATFAKVVRQMNSGVKILAISGMSAGGLGQHMQPFEGAIMQKPFKAEALLLAVDKLLHNKTDQGLAASNGKPPWPEPLAAPEVSGSRGRP